MGRKLGLCLCILLVSSMVNAGDWVPLTSPDPAPARIEVVSSSLQETILSVSIPGYYRDEVKLDGQIYVLYSLQSDHNLMEKGCPTLPFEAVNVAVVNRGAVFWTVEKGKMVSHFVENYLPSKGHFTRNIDPETVPYTFSKVYDTDAPYPSSIINMGEPFILRNVRGVNISIRPFQYNSVQQEMTITTSFQVRIATSGHAGKNILTDDMIVPESKVFQNIYRTRFINYDRIVQRYTAIGEVGNMLIITNDSFYNDMLPFLYWKLQKGIPCQMVNLSTVGSTAADVQTYIQNEYDTNGVTFVLLVGDADEMPSLIGTAESVRSDPSYAFMTGGDSYPELFVSRFPAETTTETQIMVNRIVNYEKTPMSGSSGSWYHKAFGIGGDDTGGTGLADWERVDLLKDVMVTPAYNYTEFTEIYHSSATAAQVTAAVNDGRGIGLYIGHGGQTSWGTTGFDVTDTYNLTNTDLVPLVHSVACLVGQFYYSSDCFSEAWQKSGTPAAPTGAVAHYGSVTNQSWVPPCDAQTETVDLLVTESYHSVGALCFNGTMGGMDLWPGSEANTLMQQWHIFGDCSTVIYTDELTTMSVSHAGMLPVSQATYDVTVTGVEDALCALYNETTHVLYGSNYTDAAGQTTITLDPVPGSVMTLKLTVTAFNKMPYFDDVDVIVPNGPWLVHNAHVIDDSSGNGDGIINPGESIVMSITLENIGADPATSVSATLSTASAHCSVSDHYADYPDIAVSATGLSLPNHYTFDVLGTAPNGEVISFDLDWSADGGYSDTTHFNVSVCELLDITSVQSSDITGTSARITWTTNVPASSTVYYGDSTPPSLIEEDTSLVQSHDIVLTGLSECTDYYFEVESTSVGCYTTFDDNGGGYHQFTTGMNVNPTYNSSDTPIAITDTTTIVSTIAVSDNKTVLDVDVTVNITHTYDGDLDISLIAPDLTTIDLCSDNGGTGENFTDTVFDDEAATSITSGTAPFTGSFQPEQALSAMDGLNAAGDWQLQIYDDASGDTGSLISWSITFTFPSQSCGPHAAYNSHTLVDDNCVTGGAGDADGIWDAGEQVQFSVTLINDGTDPLTGVTATITPLTAGVSVVNGTASFSNIAVDSTQTSTSPHFSIQLSDTLNCADMIDFQIDITTNEGNFNDTFSENIGLTIPGNFTLVSEDFEGSWGPQGDNPPAGWTIEDHGDESPAIWNNNDWYRYNKGGAYGYIARAYYSPIENQDEWLITPAFDIPVAATSVDLDFDHYFYVYSTPDEYGYVDYTSDQNPGWNTIITYTATTADMAHETLSLAAYAGDTNAQIRFRYVANNDWYWEVDNVVIAGVQPETCDMNTCDSGSSVEEVPNGEGAGNPATVGISGNDIVLTFDPATGATNYNVYRGSLDSLSTTGAYCHDSRVTEEACAGSPDTTVVDIGAATDGNNYYYLINGNNVSCEGSFGADSAGTPRENTHWPAEACYSICP